MKIAMRKSGVFDSTAFSSPNKVLFAGDVKSKMLCFAFEELGFDSVVIMFLSRSCCAVLNCAFQLSSFLCFGMQALIFIFFCPTTFIHTISAYTRVELQPVTVASQKLHITYWLCPVCSEHKHQNIPVSAQSDFFWVFNNFRVLYQNLFFIEHFSWLVLIFDCKISEWIRQWIYTRLTLPWQLFREKQNWNPYLVVRTQKLGLNPRLWLVMLVFGFKERPHPFFYATSDPAGVAAFWRPATRATARPASPACGSWAGLTGRTCLGHRDPCAERSNLWAC